MCSRRCNKATPYLALVLLTLFSVYFHPPFENFPTTAATTLSPPWKLYVDSFSFLIPALIIDTNILQSIIVGSSLNQTTTKLTVAVEEHFRGMKIADNEENLDVVFYNKSVKDRDYWLFEMGMEKRAMRPFEMHSTYLAYFPSNIPAFLDDWNYSRLIACNVLIHRNSNERRIIPLHFASEMARLRDFIKDRHARLMLAEGTLLGWFRECSLIPHTGDIDFFIRAEDYNPSILSDLDVNESPYKVNRIYGLPSDSYELTVAVKNSPQVNIDIFFLYTNSNESYIGGLDWDARKKYKWTFPRITHLCTADFLGHLFHVPCNTKEFLDAEYGNWRVDAASSEYIWNKSSKNVRDNGYYTSEEMQKMRTNGWRLSKLWNSLWRTA